MSEELMFALSVVSLLVSAASLFAATRMNDYQRHEYRFFLHEHSAKLGREPGRLAKFLSLNAALGGGAPEWHWIKPVVSPKDSFQ